MVEAKRFHERFDIRDDVGFCVGSLNNNSARDRGFPPVLSSNFTTAYGRIRP